MSVIHVLIKRYSDNSGFYVLGATTEDAVAEAFCIGGSDGAAKAESYAVDTEASPRHLDSAIQPEDWKQ